ncbi:putative manganese-dependent inorganic pyrophosphatase domain protein, partial [Vibrio parahaemolyticus V-223/04]
PRHR